VRAPVDAAEVDSYTAAELAAAAGVPIDTVKELQGFGLLAAQSGSGGAAYFDADGLEVVRLAAAFRLHGVEARHLRAWKTSAEREASLFEQVIMPLLHQRNPQARRQASETLEELAGFGAQLREVLLRQALRSVR
jgi:DNA-binding transcriptional MerR regulator